MKLIQASVIETDGKRMVEMTFAENPNPEEDEAQIHFVVPVSADQYPRIPEAQLEALQHVRRVIGDEHERIEGIRGRVHPGEDWRK